MSNITKAQKEHQTDIATAFLKEHKAKYLAGALEHKGNLRDVPKKILLDFAIEEVLDLVSYLYTLREALEYSEE